MSLLDVSNAFVRFDGVTAVNDVSFSLDDGEFVGLIGPNGAGKTTLLKVISGVLPPGGGRVVLNGQDVSDKPPFVRARAGLGLSHQIVRPFRSMTPVDNVALAAGATETRNPLKALARTDRTAARARARELLDLVGIGDAAEADPSNLPLGYLKRLEVARALALEPKLLLLDEPLAGLNHVEAGRLADTVTAINGQGTTVLLIEHNLSEVMRICRRLLVLDQGRLIADGAPQTVMSDARVRAAYLGESTEDADAAA